jgi:MOSC domain-containing protein YiiM
MAEVQVGKILAIALRTSPNEAVKDLKQAVARENGGLEGDISGGPDGCITFLASRQWEEVVRLLGSVLLWHSGGANVLVEANTLASSIGKTIRFGAVMVEMKGPVVPSSLIDEVRPGLRELLKSDYRGGVFGRVVKGGTFAVGDMITLAL